MSTKKNREKAAKYLRSTATHFVERDWNYTRKTNLKRIRYKDEWQGSGSLWGRLKMTKFLLVGSRKSSLHQELFRREKGWWTLPRLWHHVRAALIVGMGTDKHLPDGQLDNGNILVYWEETAEYIQVVQPSVGELLSNFLLEEPDHPHAVLIANEIDRILKGYSARAKAGEVSGRKSAGTSD